MSKYIKLEDAIYVDCILMGEIECDECPFYDVKRNICRMVEWLESLPTIEVSEDCISREYLLSKVYDMDNDNLVVDLKDIENAPSVVPKRGVWKAKSFHECFCDNCGFIFDIMKCDFLENMKFCPNCGAKMKGADNE